MSPRSHASALLLLLLGGLLIGCSGQPRPRSAERGPTPENIILMIADGCGFHHLQAADFWQDGGPEGQPYRHWPVAMAMATTPHGRTYEADRFWNEPGVAEDHPTDSAAAITAMTTGVKTLNKRLCVDAEGGRLRTLVEAMESSGRATGVVSSVLFAHATPAGTSVFNAHRNNYLEISQAMIQTSTLDLIMGPGHPLREKNGTLAEAPDYRYVGGESTWQALLEGRAGGDADGDGTPDPWQLVQTRQEFLDLATTPSPRRVIGVPLVRKTLQQERAGDTQAAPYAVPLIPDIPTLEEMTRAALNVLPRTPEGSFLMIEGGAVDWASHDNHFGRMIEEVVDFHHTVAAVSEWVERHGGWEKNLVIITADHETGYLTGPEPADGLWPSCRALVPLENRGQGRQPGFTWNSGHHTNSLVPLFARGAGCEELLTEVIGNDPVRGPYVDNTALGRLLMGLAKRADR